MPEVQRDSFSIAQFVLFSAVIFVWNVYAFSITNEKKKTIQKCFSLLLSSNVFFDWWNLKIHLRLEAAVLATHLVNLSIVEA